VKEKHLVDEANAVIVQKHQVSTVTNKLNEINNNLDDIKKSQSESDVLLDELMGQMQELLENTDENSMIDVNLETVEKELNCEPICTKITTIDPLEQIDFSKSMSWLDYLNSVDEYAKKYNLNLANDPFKNLMSKSQILELQKRIKEDFAYKNANCDKYDYMIAGTCGVIGGIIDVLFVGKPGESDLGNFVDKKANDITMKFAEMLGWDREKARTKGSNELKSAIGFLENKFKINYDQSTTNGKKGTGGLVENLSSLNHHLKSLGHSPDLIGLFFSILNQFTNTSSFISNGQLITINTDAFELQGGNFIAKIFCGFCNWLGHLMSDWVGSTGATGRGSGIPIPFYELFLLFDFGQFRYKPNDKKKKEVLLSFAEVCTVVFQKGYDLRHGITMAIPVLITELLIRVMYTLKARFYHEKDWKECIPNANIPELRRMLLVGHGTLCMIDAADAGIRSGGNMVEFLLRTNLIGWVRFGYLGLKELNAWYNSGEIDPEKVDEYIEKELYLMVRND
jgi:hypothetical protein